MNIKMTEEVLKQAIPDYKYSKPNRQRKYIQVSTKPNRAERRAGKQSHYGKQGKH